jgi:sialic acid synthase SpsE
VHIALGADLIEKHFTLDRRCGQLVSFDDFAV